MQFNNGIMKISIIIPTYNRANLIGNTLESLLNQDFPKEDYEIIIVDNNSTDNTFHVISKFTAQHNGFCNLKYIQESRQGDVYARHTGVSNADGDILFFTDDDALFDKNWLSTADDLFNLYPSIGALGTRIMIKWDTQPKAWVKHFEYLLGRITYNDSGYVIKSTGLHINNGSLAIKKSLFIEVGGNNPGQVGEFLIGDAEAGLCRKLHQKNIPIAFTDDTCMWHLQFKKKNGGFSDIKRRIQNNAIADAYKEIIVDSNLDQIDNFKIYKSIFRLFLAILFFKRMKVYNLIFQYFYYVKKKEYLWKFQFDLALLSKIQNNDYILGENYKSSGPIINIKYLI